MFLPDAFYDACDEFGILIYHDMQYAQEGHSPAVGAPQDPELRYQIRRLSSHPSIAIWDGCNECQVVLNTSTGICKPPAAASANRRLVRESCFLIVAKLRRGV